MDTPAAQFPVPAAADLQKTLDEIVASGVAPGVTVVVEHPAYPRWSGAAGLANLETKETLTAAHRFRAGSILKMALATSVLQLVEQKKRSLDEKVTQVLPENITKRIPNADVVTIRMLLNHTSGIPEFTDGDFNAKVFEAPLHQWSLDEILGRIEGRQAVFAPGTGWSYSNTNYTLLGEIVSVTAGKPWRDVVFENVFSRAKLSASVLPPVGDAACSGCSRGYELVDQKPVDMSVCDPSMAGAAGGGALVTTTSDLVTFMRALSEGKLFNDAETLKTMLDLVDAPEPEMAQTAYGLGVAQFKAGEIVLLGHLGGTAGFQSFVFIHPESKIVASGFMNRTGDLGAFIRPVLDAIGRIP